MQNPYQNQPDDPMSTLEEYKGWEKVYTNMLNDLQKTKADTSNPYYDNSPEIKAQEAAIRANLDAIRSSKIELQANLLGITPNETAQGGGYWNADKALSDVQAYQYAVNSPNAQTDATRQWLSNLSPEQTATMQQAATNIGYFDKGMPAEKPKGIATPNWLQTGEYVPGLKGLSQIPSTGNLPETVKPVASTPSLQGWNKLSPSKQTALTSYMKWAGQSPEDVLWSTSRQTPQNPSLSKRYTAWR
jgi:hypothetical protein